MRKKVVLGSGKPYFLKEFFQEFFHVLNVILYGIVIKIPYVYFYHLYLILVYTTPSCVKGTIDPKTAI